MFLTTKRRKGGLTIKRNIQYKKALRLLGHKFSPKDNEEKYNWVDASIQYAAERLD